MPNRQELDAHFQGFTPVPTRPNFSAEEIGQMKREDPNLFVDTFKGVIGGAERAVRSVVKLVDPILPDELDPWKTHGVKQFTPETETLLGGLVGGISQFAVGFAGVGVLGKALTSVAGRINGAPVILRTLTAGSERVKKLSAAGKTGQAMLLNAAIQGGVRGSVTDFVAFAEDEERLANMAKDAGIAAPLAELLAMDENDSAFVGRLKNVGEGLLVGGVFSIGIDVVKRSLLRTRRVKANIQSGMAPEEAITKALDEVPEPPPLTQTTVVNENGLLKTVPTDVEEVPYIVRGRLKGDTSVDFSGTIDSNISDKFDFEVGTFLVKKDDSLLALAKEEYAKQIEEYNKLPKAVREFDQSTPPTLGSVYRRLEIDKDEEPVRLLLEKMKADRLEQERLQQVSGTSRVTAQQQADTIIADAKAKADDLTVKETPSVRRKREEQAKRIAQIVDGMDSKTELESYRDNLFIRRREENLNLPFRKLSVDTLKRLEATRGFPNMEMFDGPTDSLIRLFYATTDIPLTASDLGKINQVEFRASAVTKLSSILGGGQRHITRFLSTIQGHPEILVKVGRDVQVAKFIATKAAEEVRPAILSMMRAIKTGAPVDNVQLRELVSRVRQGPMLLEAVRDTMSRAGFLLNQHKKFIGIDEVATNKTVFNWKQADNIDSLIDAGLTDANRGEIHRMLKEIEAIMQNDDPLAALAGLEAWQNASVLGKGVMVAREYFVNSILSNPASWVANLSGVPMVSTWRLMENSIGAIMSRRKIANRLGDVKNFNAGGVQGPLNFPLIERLETNIRNAERIMQEELETYSHMLNGAAEAWEITRRGDGVGYTRTNKLERNMSPIKQLTAGRGDAAEFVGKVLTGPSTIMETGDIWAKVNAYRSHARAKLMTRAINEGVPEASRKTWVEEHLKLLANNRGDLRSSIAMDMVLPKVIAEGHDDIAGEVARRLDVMSKEVDAMVEIHDASIRYGESLTFSSPDGDGFFQATGRYVSRWINDYPALGFMVPFIRTPANIAQFSWDRSFGVVLETAALATNKLFNWSPKMQGRLFQLQRQLMDPSMAVRAEANGRIVTSMMVMTGAMSLTLMGDDDGFPLVTGGAPEDKEERRALEQAGWQPYSIRVGGKYIQYSRLDPIASFMGIAADYAQVMSRMATDPTKDEFGLEAVSVAVVAAMARNLTNKTYLQGLASMLEASSGDTSKVAAAIGATAGGFIPSIVAGQVGAVDGEVREIRSILDRMMARTPGLSSHLSPRRNLLGEKIARPSSTGLTALDAWLPTRVADIADDVIFEEVAALKFGFNVPGVVTRGVDLTDPAYVVNGQDAYDRYTELSSQVKLGGKDLRQALRVLIQSPQYQALAPTMDETGQKSPRVDMINSFLSKYRKKAWTELLRERPELQREIKQLKETRKRPRLTQ